MKAIVVDDRYVLKKTYEKSQRESIDPIDVVTSYVKLGIHYPYPIFSLPGDKELPFFKQTGMTFLEWDRMVNLSSCPPLTITNEYVVSTLAQLADSGQESLDELVTKYARRCIWYENRGIAKDLEGRTAEEFEREEGMTFEEARERNRRENEERLRKHMDDDPNFRKLIEEIEARKLRAKDH